MNQNTVNSSSASQHQISIASYNTFKLGEHEVDSERQYLKNRISELKQQLESEEDPENQQALKRKLNKKEKRLTRINQKISAIATQIKNLDFPDIIALQEVGDSDGKQISLTYTNNVTAELAALTVEISEMSATQSIVYEPLSLQPVTGSTGGVPGLNIRNAFLVKRSFIDRTDEQTLGALKHNLTFLPNQPLTQASLRESESVFARSRIPLVLSFTINGQQYVVINVHLQSKIGENLPLGVCHPDGERSHRGRQCAAIAQYLNSLNDKDKQNVIVIGDFNSYWYCDELKPLKDIGLRSVLSDKLPNQSSYSLWDTDKGVDKLEIDNSDEKERFTYQYNGVYQTLDNIFVGGNTRDSNTTKIHFYYAHWNSILDRDKAIASDHDPLLIVLHNADSAQSTRQP